MTWIVRKYIAYLVFDSQEGENSETFEEIYAFEPSTNKVAPALFESQITGRYNDALKKARELNAGNKPTPPNQMNREKA